MFVRLIDMEATVEHDRREDDSAHDARVPPDETTLDQPASGFDIDVDRAVGHEIMLDETNWIP